MATSQPRPSQPDDAATAADRHVSSRRGFLSSQVRAVLATAAVVAVLGVASVPWLLSSPARVSGFIAERLPQLQADVRIGRVKLGWLGPCVLEDVRVVPRDGSRPPLAIGRVEMSHGLAGILLSLGDIGRVRLEGLEADVVFDADRNSNLAGLFRNAPPGAAGGPDVAPRPRRAAVRLRLEVVGAIVRIAGPWSAEPWVSDPLHVRAALAPAERGAWSEWTLEPVQLLTDARLEPAVAQGVLAYIAPIIADATRTGGRFSLRLDGAQLPVGAPGDGRLSGSLTMHAVDLGPGPLAVNVIRSLPFSLPAPPAVRIADQSHVEFRLADRKIWHKGLEFGVPLAKPGQRLDLVSSGAVGLDDKALDMKLELPIPADLPQDRPLLASLAGRTFSLRIGGALGEPRVNFDGSIKANAGGVVAELVDRLRGGAAPQPRQPQGTAPIEPPPPADTSEAAAAKKTDGAATAPEGSEAKKDLTAEAVIDLVGGVIGEVAKRRAERRAAEAGEAGQAAPPRRGRLLRRMLPPTEPAAGTGAAAPETPRLEPVPTPAAGE